MICKQFDKQVNFVNPGGQICFRQYVVNLDSAQRFRSHHHFFESLLVSSLGVLQPLFLWILFRYHVFTFFLDFSPIHFRCFYLKIKTNRATLTKWLMQECKGCMTLFRIIPLINTIFPQIWESSISQIYFLDFYDNDWLICYFSNYDFEYEFIISKKSEHMNFRIRTKIAWKSVKLSNQRCTLHISSFPPKSTPQKAY